MLLQLDVTVNPDGPSVCDVLRIFLQWLCLCHSTVNTDGLNGHLLLSSSLALFNKQTWLSIYNVIAILTTSFSKRKVQGD